VAVQPGYLAYILEQLGGVQGVDRVTSRRMFGGIGLYSGELFFGLIDDDTLFFKTDESNSAEYLARNMPRFMPPVNRPMGPMGYHQVPADIIEDPDALVSWARKAVTVAMVANVAKARAPKARARKARTPKARKKVRR
jgi:DNA transformation protein